jgi:hypothetical protein
MIRKILLLSPALIWIGCTQFTDDEMLSKSTYTGNDGCIYCHTNAERLKVLAEEEDSGHGSGGG